MAKNPEVDQFMAKLDHPLKTEIEFIRSFILDSDPEITENIKWNAPSFSYKDEDRITFKLFPYDSIQLIFHRGSKIKDTKDFSFTDSSGLFKWITDDRALVTLKNIDEIQEHQAGLTQVIKEWLEYTT